jgi:hypothetical protein
LKALHFNLMCWIRGFKVGAIKFVSQVKIMALIVLYIPPGIT